MSNDPRLEAISRVWPFELEVPELRQGQGAVIHAEIWPSLDATRSRSFRSRISSLELVRPHSTI